MSGAMDPRKISQLRSQQVAITCENIVLAKIELPVVLKNKQNNLKNNLEADSNLNTSMHPKFRIATPETMNIKLDPNRKISKSKKTIKKASGKFTSKGRYTVHLRNPFPKDTGKLQRIIIPKLLETCDENEIESDNENELDDEDQ